MLLFLRQKDIKPKLNNQGFVAKAPEKVIAEERKKLAAAEDMLKKLEARLEQLNNM